MTTVSSNRVPSPLRRSLQKLGGGETSSSGSIAVPQSPGSFATEATARSSISGNNEDLFFRIIDSSSQGHLAGGSSKSDSSSFRNKASMWNSSPNLKVDPGDLGDNKWEFDTVEFNSSFNADARPRKLSSMVPDEGNSGERSQGAAPNRAAPGRTSSFSMKPVRPDRVTPSVSMAASVVDDPCSEVGIDNQKSDIACLDQQSSSNKVKKRIKVRAGELNMDSSTGSKSIDRQHVEEAVRRWQSEHGKGSSTDGDLNSMQRMVSRRRVSSATDGKDGEMTGMNASDGGGERIRVIVRRSKSLDESSSSFMAALAAGGESAPRRATRRSMTSAAAPSRARSRSRGRRCSTTPPELPDGERASENDSSGCERALAKPRQRSVSRGRRMSVSQALSSTKEVDKEQVVRDAPTRSRQRSVSRGRRMSLAPSAEEDSQAAPSRSRSRLGDRRASCAPGDEKVTAQRSHSLGRHLQRSNHEAQVKERKAAVSSRSVCLKSAGGESRETAMSAPGRLSTAGSGGILQRRRSRSIARADSRSSESVASTSRKPLGQQHPMNDLTRNHRASSESAGSSVFSSRIAQPIDAPSQETDTESDLSRLMKETGITPEQFLKLQEAGYLIKPTG